MIGRRCARARIRCCSIVCRFFSTTSMPPRTGRCCPLYLASTAELSGRVGRRRHRRGIARAGRRNRQSDRLPMVRSGDHPLAGSLRRARRRAGGRVAALQPWPSRANRAPSSGNCGRPRIWRGCCATSETRVALGPCWRRSTAGLPKGRRLQTLWPREPCWMRSDRDDGTFGPLATPIAMGISYKSSCENSCRARSRPAHVRGSKWLGVLALAVFSK